MRGIERVIARDPGMVSPDPVRHPSGVGKGEVVFELLWFVSVKSLMSLIIPPMKKFQCSIKIPVLVVAGFLVAAGATAQLPDWRFGFEYIEIDPPFATEAQHDTLLSRLAWVTGEQRLGGININSIGGGWNGMQPTEGGAINFAQTDSWVKRIQRGGFEVVWNFENNAAWSYMANPDCINGPFTDECAPDSAHEAAWKNFVKAIVERYDGDGVEDMPGLTIPVRFYVMHQEIYFAGSGKGDDGEAVGDGYWDDNVTNLIRLHRLTWQAIHEADPTGQTKLVGSGGWFLDLYGDFPDYPEIHGPTVQGRLGGANLGGHPYTKGYDSLVALLRGLNDDSHGPACDYIGWHPHSGWKSSDQSMRFIRTYAPDKPIFIDDMWSNILTDVVPRDGFLQFLSGHTNERDFPTAAIPSYAALRDSLNANNPVALAFYNAKGARDAVKCFATIFGEGAERASYSLSNDFNPSNPIFLLSQSWRYTGLVGNKNTNYLQKPVTYTMQILVDRLHDFTSVTRIFLTANPYTRCYRFERKRGRPCYLLWSESTPDPTDPSVPNGETVSLPVSTDSVLLTHIVTQPGITSPSTSRLYLPGFSYSVQLGFEPIILEELPGTTGAVPNNDDTRGRVVNNVSITQQPGALRINFTLQHPSPIRADIFTITGLRVATLLDATYESGTHTLLHSTEGLARGVYLVRIGGVATMVVIGDYR